MPLTCVLSPLLTHNPPTCCPQLNIRKLLEDASRPTTLCLSPCVLSPLTHNPPTCCPQLNIRKLLEDASRPTTLCLSPCVLSPLTHDPPTCCPQLNIRKLLEDASRPTINIVCQKVAATGKTRFEDRRRLPLGVSINFSSYSGG